VERVQGTRNALEKHSLNAVEESTVLNLLSEQERGSMSESEKEIWKKINSIDFESLKGGTQLIGIQKQPVTVTSSEASAVKAALPTVTKPVDDYKGPYSPGYSYAPPGVAYPSGFPMGPPFAPYTPPGMPQYPSVVPPQSILTPPQTAQQPVAQPQQQQNQQQNQQSGQQKSAENQTNGQQQNRGNYKGRNFDPNFKARMNQNRNNQNQKKDGTGDSKKPSVQCEYCHRFGHEVKDCWAKKMQDQNSADLVKAIAGLLKGSGLVENGRAN